MSGCRPLTEFETERVKAQLTNPRDLCLFIMGLYTGFRISELLSLRVCDVYANGHVLSQARAFGKGGKSRTVVLHPEVRAAIENLISTYSDASQGDPLFLSERRLWNGGPRALSRCMAHLIIKRACKDAEVFGHVATHTMRKTFAEKMYLALGKDLIATRDALGHSDIRATASYICVNQSAIDRAILGGA